MKQLTVLAVAALLSTTAFARDLVWTGAVNSDWDKGATANWKDVSTDDACTFADGDNVTFDDTAANKTVNIAVGNIKPTTITFDHDANYAFGSTAKANYLGGTVSSFVKRGTGTLTIATAAADYFFSRMTCDFNLYAGNVLLNTANCTQLLGDGANAGKKNKLFKVYVHSGATLTAHKLTLGKYADVIVEAGGTYDWVGPSWSRQTFANLTLYGGANFEMTVHAGTNFGLELFSVTNQLHFTGTTPYVLDQDASNNLKDQPLGLWPATQIKVDDITGDEGVDATINLKIIDADGTSAVPSGFVKTGAGTLLLSGNNSNYTSQGKNSTFSGDIIVREGTLMAGVLEDASVIMENILGSTNVDRKIVVEEGATFCFPNRTLLGAFAAITNDIPKLAWEIKGTLAISNGQSEALGNITFDGGSLAPSQGMNNHGRLLVMGTMAFKGAEAYSFDKYDGATAKQNSILLNGYPQTTFDVQDAAGLVTFDVPFMIGGGYFSGLASGACGEHEFGFRKTGLGTMRITAAKLPNETIAGTSYTNRGVNGVASVEAGALIVDGSLETAKGIAVSQGAFVGGTGTVQNVTLADGAGFRVRAADTNSLRIAGDLTVNGTPCFCFDSLPAGPVAVAEVDGTIAGTFDAAPVYVGGTLVPNMHVVCRGNTIFVAQKSGLLLLVR